MIPIYPCALIVALTLTAGAFLFSAVGGVHDASADGLSAEVRMVNLAFEPETQQVEVGGSVTWINITGPTHKVREDNQRFVSPNIPQGASFTFSFTSSGRYSYKCELHPFMRGTILVVEASARGPQQHSPSPGATLPAMSTRLQWTNPLGARQVHLQVIPANNDGPGVDVVLGPSSEFELPAPPAWYGLLPGMTYRWRVRTTDQELPVTADHPTWGTWGESTFRTPVVSSDGIAPVSPPNGGGVAGLAPALSWSNTRGDVFYYELQLSKDSGFNTDANTAIGPVYGALVHGGVTTPANTYHVPSEAPLEAGTTYYWRVRPRVQGDGVPVPFSPAFSFRTP